MSAQEPFDPRTSSIVSGREDDAKYRTFRGTIAATSTIEMDTGLADSLFIDAGSVTLGDLTIRFDSCTLPFNIKRGLFLRAMPWRKMFLTNTTGAPIVYGIVLSINSRFLVIAPQS